MPELHKAGVAYLIAIANFYYQSHGFSKFYNQLYAYWKCTPILILISFVAVHGGGIPVKKRALLAIALTCGCMGDYMIGMSVEGIVPGAISFGIGHIFYLILFVHETRRLWWELAAILGVWGLIMGLVCIMPILKISVIAVLILAIYSVILSCTLLHSSSQYVYGSTVHKASTSPVMWRLFGFALFYISDTILIMAHTGVRIPAAEICILSTYYAAQYLLVRAEVSYAKLLQIKGNKTQ